MIPLDRDSILAAFRAHKNRPLKAVDVGKFLELPPEGRSALRALLRVLVDEGELVPVERRRFALAAAGDTHEGVARLSSKGYGWFAPDTPGEPDAFIPPDETEELIDGDRIRARIEPSAKGPVARVKRVLARGRTSVVGVYSKSDGGIAAEVKVAPGVMRRSVLVVHRDGDPQPKDGDLVEVQISRYPTYVRAAMGHLIRVLGQAGHPDAEIEKILEEHQVIREFSPEALAQAGALGDAPSEADVAGRHDLRDTPLCTIDGATAKDFDDAVFAARNGHDIEIIVAIADVAHYVQDGSALDEDAKDRGTSLYYPGRVVPMLPEDLSNGLCSLKPEVERLCMSVRFLVSPSGETRNFKFHNSVMRSHARLTYAQVAAHFDGSQPLEAPSGVKKSLSQLREAAKRLNAKRRERGMLDFNLAEPVFELDEEGVPRGSIRSPRNEAHRLIEELMIAANEAVAEHFFRRDLPCMYRVHEPPDPQKLERFLSFARKTARAHDVKVLSDVPVTAKGVGSLTAALGETPLREALDSLLLRAMMKAHYNAENLGHFSLASDAYLHFTSPIRRYPDLEVHRQLKKWIAKKRKLNVEQKESEFARLDKLAKDMSDREREAMACERDISALLATWLLREREGEEMSGRITSVAEFGAFVKVEPLHLDALIPIAGLSRDFLELDEDGMRLVADRSGFSIGVGDRVSVSVESANLSRRQTVLRLDRVTEQFGRVVDIVPSRRDTGDDDDRGRGPGRRKRGKDGVDRPTRRRGKR
jgi:ribonuclease R